MPFFNTFQHARVMRLVARLRCDYPLLLFLPYFLTGQIAAFFVPVPAWASFSACLAFGLFSRLAPRSLAEHFVAISIFACGAASMAFCLSTDSPVQLEAETSYFAKVDKRPRYKSPGGVEISLAISAKLKKDSREESGELLHSSVHALCRGVDLPWKNATNLLPGDIVAIKGTFRPIAKPLNPFGYQATLFRHGYRFSCRLQYLAPVYRPPTPFFEQLRLGIAARVRQLLGDKEITGLFLAMSIGTPDAITGTTEDAFKRTGLAHLLVVSGCQVTLVFGAMFLFCSLLLSQIGGRIGLPVASTCAYLGLAGAVAFVELSGIEGSSLRAVFAIMSVVISLVLELSLGMFHAILSSLLLISVMWPGALFEPGVQLTYAALTGICIGRQTHLKNRWMTYLIICWCASLFTSLIVACWFGMFSITGFILNPLLATPASIVSCNIGLLAIIAYISGLDPWGIGLRMCAWIISCMRDAIVWVSDFSLAGFHIDGWSKGVVIGALAILCSRQVISSVERYYNERV